MGVLSVQREKGDQYREGEMTMEGRIPASADT